MTSPDTFAIDEIPEFELSADGEYLRFKSEHTPAIAMHCSVMHPMLAALCAAIARSDGLRKVERGRKFAMPCDAWEIGADRNGTHFVLTYRLPGGAELSFQMKRAQATQMSEVLATVTGVLKSAHRPRHMQ